MAEISRVAVFGKLNPLAANLALDLGEAGEAP